MYLEAQVSGCGNQNLCTLEFGGVSEVLGKRMAIRFLTLYCLGTACEAIYAE